MSHHTPTPPERGPDLSADDRPAESFLPLTAPAYHVLLALGERALHGYAMMQSLEEKTGGREVLLPGTLYATIARLVAQGLLEEVEPEPRSDARRRTYRVTPLGRRVARAESERLRLLLEIAAREHLAPETSP